MTLQTQLTALLSHQEYLEARYSNSPWDSGPLYRTQLAEVAEKILHLKEKLRHE